MNSQENMMHGSCSSACLAANKARPAGAPASIVHMTRSIWILICLQMWWQCLPPQWHPLSALSARKKVCIHPPIFHSLWVQEGLCVPGSSPILCGCLQKAAVSIMLWQHFMLPNDKWRGKGRAEVQLKQSHTHTHEQWHRRVRTWIRSLRLPLAYTLCLPAG